MDQDLPRHVQAEPLEKSNSFEKVATELKAKIDTDEVACEDGASDNSEMEQFELIKDVSTKEAIVSDGNDTDSSFGVIDSENKVKKVIHSKGQ